jgi:succinoglycan biosynthesis protein ExoO
VPAHPNTPTVTVLLAAYNAEAFLQRAVSSALAQSIDELELVIVDDASTDDTAKLVERLAATDRRIRLVRQRSNGGPAAARNAGLDVATGEWIAVLDADDAYMPHRLERMVRAARTIDADVVLGNFRYFNPETGNTGSPALKEGSDIRSITLAEFLSKARPYTGEADWGLLKPLMKRSFLQTHELRYPVFSRHGEDFLFLVEAFLSGARCALYPEASYLYTSRHEKYSRTIVNYQLMWQHAAALMNDPRIRNDLVVLGCLRERVAAVRRLSAETDLARGRREGAYGFLARRLLFDAAFRSLVWDRAWQKLNGHRRH